MSKTIIHKANGREWALVDFPKGSSEFTLNWQGFKNRIGYYDVSKRTMRYKELNDCEKYIIHCLASEATEKQAKEVVEEVDCGYKGYDYRNDDTLFWRESISSLHSLCRSHGIEPENCLILKIKN